MSICFILTSGCVFTENSEVALENQNATASNPQPELSTSQPAVAAPLPEAPSAGVENKTFGREEVKRIQSHLKRTGFYSGAVDGIAGARTQSAIRHFQSGCATLRDLISISDPGAIQESSGLAAKAAIAKNEHTTEAVRLVQVRLKDAGFNPGPIDGIDGVKTQSALSALQSGCKMLDPISIAPIDGVRGALLDGPAKATEAGALSLRVTNRGSQDFTGIASKNSSREAVKVLQTRLREAGFDPGPSDGILGPRTKAAAQNYQSSLR